VQVHEGMCSDVSEFVEGVVLDHFVEEGGNENHKVGIERNSVGGLRLCQNNFRSCERSFDLSAKK
jgi:hypothetical protein